MYIRIRLDGFEYETDPDDDVSYVTADDLSKYISAHVSLVISIADKQTLVLGKDAMQRAHFVFCEEKSE